jgi:ligand-binding sensor domain-containing protein
VKDVFVDDVGNEWFGTKEGVQKYDGVTWTTYDTANSPLPNNTVYAIAQDTLGYMWFGTSHGIACFDGSAWQVYTDLGGGATNVAVRGIGVDSQNRIWTGNNPDDYGDPGGVSVFDGSTWTRHDPNPSSIGQYFLSLTVDGNTSSNSDLMGNQIECFAVEQDSVVWIANHTSSDGGVSRFDGTTWTNYGVGDSGIGHRSIYSISIDGTDKYFGTEIYGMTKFDGSSWSTYKTSSEPHCNRITSIDKDSVGNIYFGTYFYGVATLNAGTWSYYYSGNSGLSGNYVNCVCVDKLDILWVGTQYSGLFKFDGITWTNYNTSNSGLLGDIILSIAGDSFGNVWLGTAGWDGPMEQDGAVAKFDGATWTNYYLSNSGLIDDDGLNVAVDHGDTVWIGTEEGISKFDQFTNSWTSYTTADGLVHDWVTRTAIGPTNEKWFATRGGVSMFDGTKWTNYTTATGIAGNDVRDIAVDGVDICIATATGASVLDGGTWETYRQTEGLVDDDVSSVCVDGLGYKWFGSVSSGISRYDDSGAGISLPESPEAFRLVAYPNPSCDRMHICYHAEGAAGICRTLKIYDLSGRLVRSLGSSASDSGTVLWDGRNETGEKVATGVYFVNLQTMAGKTVATRKLVLVK